MNDELHPHAALGLIVFNTGPNFRQVVALRTLKQFWQRHPQAEGPVRSWVDAARRARWGGPQEVKRAFGGNVDFIADNRAIFDLGGNKYRLVVHISYRYRRILVKFIGTHAAYDRIEPERI